jgi:hypothetical protein
MSRDAAPGTWGGHEGYLGGRVRSSLGPRFVANDEATPTCPLPLTPRSPAPQPPPPAPRIPSLPP